MSDGTVITTVYNGAKFVPRYCDVVADARSRNPALRWLLCDDGSDDGTLSLTMEALRRRGLHDSVEGLAVGRLGRAAALNAAVRRVNTDVFFVHDFDDVSFSERFDAQRTLLQREPKVACVGGGYIHVNADNGGEERRGAAFVYEEYLRRFPLYVPFPHTFMAFRTVAVREVDGYPIWDDYEEMGLIGKLIDANWRLESVPGIVGRHFVYKTSFFENQHGFARRRWRNLRRQLEMRSLFPFIAVSRTAMVGRFAYNFLPTPAKAALRRAVRYAG
jgi:glycosyltransferase involved in cell wall biosynthesis